MPAAFRGGWRRAMTPCSTFQGRLRSHQVSRSFACCQIRSACSPSPASAYGTSGLERSNELPGTLSFDVTGTAADVEDEGAGRAAAARSPVVRQCAARQGRFPWPADARHRPESRIDAGNLNEPSEAHGRRSAVRRSSEPHQRSEQGSTTLEPWPRANPATKPFAESGGGGIRTLDPPNDG